MAMAKKVSIRFHLYDYDQVFECDEIMYANPFIVMRCGEKEVWANSEYIQSVVIRGDNGEENSTISEIPGLD